MNVKYPWLDQARELISSGDDHNGIYLLMEKLDRMMCEGRWEELECILTSVDPRVEHIDFSLTFLTMLWPGRKKIKFAEYAARCRRAYHRIAPLDVEGLMKGFENLDQPKSQFINYGDN